MLGYSVESKKYVEAGEGVSFSDEQIGSNPFPGLRPFTLNESHLFFGREDHVDEIMMKLATNRAVSVMGYSGSGKSSLLSCGLIPELLGGFMPKYGANWRVVTVRPGSTPIHNLAKAMVDSLVQSGKVDYADAKIHQASLSSVLQRGQDGLVEVVKFIHTKNENFFLLIDQFEEIFRYKEIDDPTALNEATAYVNMIQHAVYQVEVPIFIVISMRSDFVGQCSVFHGLTRLINNSNYLVPQMTRENKRLAIEGPVAVGGGRIAQRLVKRILADISENQDQLTVMQHALMRTWDYWVENHEENEPMDIRHYNAVGKVSQALSLHANEAYEELTLREKEITEVLFKGLTERTQDSLEIRRPVKVNTVAQLTQASESEVIKVVETFRRPGRSFLMPGTAVALHGETVLELSHESLMRIWTRLSTWVEEEYESAQMYKRISEASALYQVGKTNLWRPPDLQLALNWQKKQRPTRLWAQRYDIAFERAIVFLDTSRVTYELELQNREMLQRRNLRRLRVTSLIMGIAALISTGFFFYGYTQQIKAEVKAREAQTQRSRAEVALKDVGKQKDRAEYALKQVEAQKIELLKREKLLAANNTKLQKALHDAEAQKIIAQRALEDANRQKDIANGAKDEAKSQYDRAEENYKQANSLLMLSIAQSMEAKSVSIEDPELAGLTAMQGFNFHKKFGGGDYDPYIFSGLYTALIKANGDNYNIMTVPGRYKSRMLALALSQKGGNFYTTGTDGQIVKGNYLTMSLNEVISKSAHSNRVLALSKNGRYLINAGDSLSIEIIDTQAGNAVRKVKPNPAMVTDIRFLPGDDEFISTDNNGYIAITHVVSGRSRILATMSSDIKSMDVSYNGSELLVGSSSGMLSLVGLATGVFNLLINESPNRILAVACHPVKPIIAYGVEVLNEKYRVVKGTVKLHDLVSGRTTELTGHTAGISDLEFNADGSLLASAGLDGKLQMWVTNHVEDLPIVMNNNNGFVWKIAFTEDSRNLLAACNNGEVRVWLTKIEELAEKVCPTLKRNMSEEEWSVYVGNKINYESTCPGLLKPEPNAASQ